VGTIAIVAATALKAKAKRVFVAQIANTKKNGQIQQIFLMENRMDEIKKYCDNCGHECHCGEKCKQEYTDGDGERYEMQICGSCKHKGKKE
jgi:hypothetical protein